MPALARRAKDQRTPEPNEARRTYRGLGQHAPDGELANYSDKFVEVPTVVVQLWTRTKQN